MRVCVIGGTGHIGKHLTPMLVDSGHEVTVVTSGRTPLPEGGPWSSVRALTLSYDSQDLPGAIAELRPQVLVDILQGRTPELYEALRGIVEHFVVCGSVWMFGRPRIVPTPPETQGPCPFEGYARRYEQMLATRERAAAEGVAFTAAMPTNICGPYKIPLDTKGGRSLEVHQALQRGEPVVLPDPGNNLIGPCDAEDIARVFACAVANRDAAAGQIFNAGSAYALTALQFVETYAEIYGVQIPIELVSWERYATEFVPEIGANWHFQAHMCPDISRTRELIGYEPAYTPEQTLERAVRWMFDTGLLTR